MMGEKQIYQSGNLTFILINDMVIVQTGLGQSFYLHPKTQYWNRRLSLIRLMIEEYQEIKSLGELAEWCARGNVEWVSTTRKFQLDNAELSVV